MQVVKFTWYIVPRMPQPGDQFDVILSFLDLEDPFEIDLGNLPHLMADPELGLDDALDVLLFDAPVFYEDDSAGSAEWLLVGEIPGGEVIVVPIARSNHSGLSKVRPITILYAPNHVIRRYREDGGW
jgi:hypothetical protein